MLPIIFQVHNFLSIWLGDYPQYAVEFCIYTLLSIYFETISAPFWMINYSDKKLRSYQIWSAVIFSLCFFIGWIVLSLGFPPYSAIIVRSFVMLLMIPYRLYMVLKKIPTYPVWLWTKQAFLRSFLVMLTPAIIMLFMTKVHFEYTIVEFIVNCSICVLLTIASIYFVGLTSQERIFVNEKIKAKIKK